MSIDLRIRLGIFGQGRTGQYHSEDGFCVAPRQGSRLVMQPSDRRSVFRTPRHFRLLENGFREWGNVAARSRTGGSDALGPWSSGLQKAAGELQ